MSIVSPIPFESLTALSRAVDDGLADRAMHTRGTAFSLCIEAVAFGREAAPGHVGTRARSAAHLLLELAYPDLGADALDQLSVACERAAVSGR